MSYPIGWQSPPAARPGRPAAVMAAAALLAVMAAAGVVNAVVGLLGLQGVIDRFRSAADATDINAGDVRAFVSALRVSVAVGLVIALVAAVLLAALAVGILKRSAGARVGTWVVCGIGALFGGCGLAILVAERLAPVDVNTADAAAILRALSDAYPGWWLPLNGALLVAQALGYLLVAVLLAVPPANQFFRRGRPLPEQSRVPAPAGPHLANRPAPSPASPVSPHHPSES
jgi:hypothetical protein